jgi:hypothetical protein
VAGLDRADSHTMRILVRNLAPDPVRIEEEVTTRETAFRRCVKREEKLERRTKGNTTE